MELYPSGCKGPHSKCGRPRKWREGSNPSNSVSIYRIFEVAGKGRKLSDVVFYLFLVA